MARTDTTRSPSEMNFCFSYRSRVAALRGKEPRTPDNLLWKVLTRPTNREVHSREHLLPDEVEVLMKAAGQVDGIG